MIQSNSVLGRIARLPLKFLPPDLVLPIMHGPLRGSNWIVGSAHHACWLGTYEREKQKRIASELKPGSVFYDVGANVGLYSLLATRLDPAGKTYAFEPLPKNTWYLHRHFELNSIHNAQVLELAISDHVGTHSFCVTGDRSTGHLGQDGNLVVRTATLDSLLQEEEIPPPDYIKMDVEGAELMALRGASECIQRHRPAIFLATHGRDMETECCRQLNSWRYELQDIGDATILDRSEFLAKFRP
jgi:FkbM family methyltransferase